MMSSAILNSATPMTCTAASEHAIKRAGTAARFSLVSLAVSCLAGVALALAHGYEWLFALALIAIATFVGAASLARRRSFGFVLGFVFGLSCFGAGVPWLFNLLDHREAPLAALLLPALLIAALGMPTAVIGACLAGPIQGRAHRLLFVAPALWIGFEWLRHQSDVAFPWLSIGYSQVAHSPLAGYAPVGGVLLTGFVTVMVAALLTVAAQRTDLRRHALLAAAA